MKGTSRLIMGATLVMAVSLVLVLGLVIVLLAELYCSLLHRRRQRKLTASSDACAAAGETTSTATAATTTSPHHQSQSRSPITASLSSFYAQGVLSAPRSILFPAVSEEKVESFDVENQHSTFSTPLQFESRTVNPKPRPGLFSSSPSPTFTPLASPKHVEKSSRSQEAGAAGGDFGAHLVYISNPMYDNEGGRPSGEDNTPFETPDSSPSRLETGDSSSGDDDDHKAENLSLTSSPATPPLTPMKKLPAEASSVSLKDARSLGTSGSDSNSNNGGSSSSSGTPCTSPSW